MIAQTSDRDLPRLQLVGAQDVRRQIAIPEAEPRLTFEPLHRSHEIPGFARETPAALGIVEVGERVEHRVDVRADVKAEMDEIVGRVDDQCQLVRRQDGGEAARELAAADAAGQRQNAPAFHRTISAIDRRSRLRPAEAG